MKRHRFNPDTLTFEPDDRSEPSMDAEDVAAWRRWAASRVGLSRRCSCMRDALDVALGLDYRSIRKGDRVITNDGPVTVTEVDDARIVCGSEEYDSTEVEIDRRTEVASANQQARDLRPLYQLAEGWREFAKPGEFHMHHAADALVMRLDRMASAKGIPEPAEPDLPEGARWDGDQVVHVDSAGRRRWTSVFQGTIRTQVDGPSRTITVGTPTWAARAVLSRAKDA